MNVHRIWAIYCLIFLGLNAAILISQGPRTSPAHIVLLVFYLLFATYNLIKWVNGPLELQGQGNG